MIPSETFITAVAVPNGVFQFLITEWKIPPEGHAQLVCDAIRTMLSGT